MSKLQEILTRARADLEPWEALPEHRWQAVADACGDAELQDIACRIQSLRSELAETPDWDGDTRDDIHRAIHLFKSLAALRRAGDGAPWPEGR